MYAPRPSRPRKAKLTLLGVETLALASTLEALAGRLDEDMSSETDGN